MTRPVRDGNSNWQAECTVLRRYRKGTKRSKSDFEVVVFWIDRHSRDFRVAYITTKGLLDLPEAIIDIVGIALNHHFHGAVRQVADLAGQLTTICHAQGGKTETYTLNPSGKSYMFCGLAHFARQVPKVHIL